MSNKPLYRLVACVILTGFTIYVVTKILFTSFNQNLLPIWPAPKHITLVPSKDKPMFLSRSLDFKTTISSNIVNNAIKRYETFITYSNAIESDCNPQAVEIKTCLIVLLNDSEVLDLDTSYDYELIISSESGDATIVAGSPYAAIYGLETLSQLFFNDTCIPHSYIYIKDQPTYRHRGLLLDVGRRIAPKLLVFDILDSLSYLKMNVFHFHLSDYCRFSLQSEQFPQLTAGLERGQFYSKEDITDIVEYARLRGIRVIPEIELPGHAKGLQSLDGEDLEFCDNTYRQIYNDPEGKSLNTLKKLIAELVNLFPDQYIHMGSDETSTNEKCTIESVRLLEEEIAHFIISLGKTPIAWEEALFYTGMEVPGMVFQAWKSFSSSSIIERNYDSIESQHRYFYMDIIPHRESSVPWLDIAPANKRLDRKRLLGGELAMWTDQYCSTRQCWNEQKWQKRRNAPLSYWMFESQFDGEFSKSLMGMIWPNGIPAAGAFWNYDETLPPSAYQFLIKHVHQVMLSRKIEACPIGCRCDELQRCGVKYRTST